MTTANKITILRILLIPVFIIEVIYYFKTGNETHRIAGLICFGVAAALDGVDGYIARHYNQRSELGAILDPLADKLLLVSGIILLSFGGQHYLKEIPIWVTVTIISRDVLVLIGLGVLQMMNVKAKVRPRILGKVATVLQMIMVLWTFLKWNSAWLPYWTFSAAVCTALAGLLYVWDGMRQMSASPASLPTPQQ